MIKSKA